MRKSSVQPSYSVPVFRFSRATDIPCFLVHGEARYVSAKWFESIQCRVIATWFDEGGIFGSKSKERFDFQSIFHLEPPTRPNDPNSSAVDTQVKHVSPDAPKERRNRHVCSTYDLFNDIPTRSSTFGVTPQDVTGEMVRRASDPNGSSSSLEDSFLQLRGNSLPSAAIGTGLAPVNDPEKEHSNTFFANALDRNEGVKVDSGWDFLSLLNSSSDSHGSDDETRNNAARTMLHAFGGVSGSSGRGWMTAPLSSALETIREDDDSDAIDKSLKQEEVQLAPTLLTIPRRGKSRNE